MLFAFLELINTPFWRTQTGRRERSSSLPCLSKSDISISNRSNRKLARKHGMRHALVTTQTERHHSPVGAHTRPISTDVASHSLHGQTLDVEHELRVGRNAGHALVAVGHVRWDGELALAAGGDALEADVPALDDLAGADLDCKGLPLLVRWRVSVHSYKRMVKYGDVPSKTLPSVNLPM